uniref:OBG-type G domain-containing protein n=1 Tax=Ananas comosus var. bracteatus TaxID=296719 RepID=A0A6V7PKK8_ANACO|nr:unnamed protein product [Ananas comosus var. bracteatus]
MLSCGSVGKSTLLTRLTGTHSEAASYEFTTLTCIPSIINYNDTKIQLLDLPGIIEGASEGKGRGRQVIAVSKSSGIVLMVLDASKVSHIFPCNPVVNFYPCISVLIKFLVPLDMSVGQFILILRSRLHPPSGKAFSFRILCVKQGAMTMIPDGGSSKKPLNKPMELTGKEKSDPSISHPDDQRKEITKTSIKRGGNGKGTTTSSSEHEGPKTPDPKILRRLAQNREAARKSRLRKKLIIHGLIFLVKVFRIAGATEIEVESKSFKHAVSVGLNEPTSCPVAIGYVGPSHVRNGVRLGRPSHV